MKKYFISLLLMVPFLGFAQNKVLNLDPVKVIELNFDEKEAIEQAKTIKQAEHICELAKQSGKKWDDYTPEQLDACLYLDEFQGYYDVLGAGCSWYCGGGPYKVEASSNLANYKNITYDGKNVHDLNYETAWCEGVEGYGIGENIKYYFKASSPRVNTIKVVNGYVKSKDAYNNNSRVKQLKVYVNDIHFADLNLQDIRSEQHFNVPLIGEKETDWVIKFEISAAYEGVKYNDVVISEIYFDGVDVH